MSREFSLPAQAFETRLNDIVVYRKRTRATVDIQKSHVTVNAFLRNALDPKNVALEGKAKYCSVSRKDNYRIELQKVFFFHRPYWHRVYRAY